ncbi:hypothetical protein Sjap_009367 [Stephania japonica]|uniref:Syntaxin 6/10/61 N-terminal domain-containing protein n=1 Tax=Stephania japonica TaxID=461633 RepID=A0AAP0PBN7_9MAGN
MASSFRQWESDPLFSAAEVVQDSADRMESIFRMLLHERSLLQGYPADQKLHDTIEYHRRDLETALGTTKWQLQDFEKAVNMSALSDRSSVIGDVISRHKQFIAAIRGQVIHVEKSLEGPSTGDFTRNTQWINLNEQDGDGLALFLSGGNSFDDQPQHNSYGSLMKQFLYSAEDSMMGDKSDEIVELKPEIIDDSQRKNISQISNSFDNLRESNLRKENSFYSSHLDLEASRPTQESPSLGQHENRDSKFATPNAKNVFFKKRSKAQSRKENILGLLGRFWSLYLCRVIRKLPKRKNEDMRETSDQRPLSANNGASCEQDRHIWTGWRGFQRLQYFIQSSRFPLQLLMIVVTILILVHHSSLLMDAHRK